MEETLQRPEEVLRRDAVHRRAETEIPRKNDDPLVGVLSRQALDQVVLGADGPVAPRGRTLDGSDDVLGGAALVGGQTTISVSGIPTRYAVSRPSCSSGRKSTFSRCPNAQREKVLFLPDED